MAKKIKRPTSEFGSLLRQLRKQRKMTMKTLADAVGVSESYVSRLESGERHPDKELILSLGAQLFPDGNQHGLDKLLVTADYTPLNLEQFTGRDELIQHFQTALETEPDNFQLYNALVLSLIKQGKQQLARQKIQEGLAKYDDSLHLQVLMGSLELLEGRYETALTYQQEAIHALKQQRPEAATHLFLQPHNMLLNLGVIYFMQGYQAIDRYLAENCMQDFELAEQSLQEAAFHLSAALKMAPEDIYILDEYARVCFNQAYLHASANKPFNYLPAIQAFEQVIHSDQKHRLNYSDLLESTLFLIHAYAKSGDFIAAETRIHLVESCLPNYWMVHYIKACLYALRYANDPQAIWIQRGLLALERAAHLPDPNNRTHSEAPVDPDLEHLRQQAPLRFKNLFALESPR